MDFHAIRKAIAVLRAQRIALERAIERERAQGELLPGVQARRVCDLNRKRRAVGKREGVLLLTLGRLTGEHVSAPIAGGSELAQRNDPNDFSGERITF